MIQKSKRDGGEVMKVIGRVLSVVYRQEDVKPSWSLSNPALGGGKRFRKRGLNLVERLHQRERRFLAGFQRRLLSREKNGFQAKRDFGLSKQKSLPKREKNPPVQGICTRSLLRKDALLRPSERASSAV